MLHLKSEKRREELEASPRKGEKRERTKWVLPEGGASSAGAGSLRREADPLLAEVIDW